MGKAFFLPGRPNQEISYSNFRKKVIGVLEFFPYGLDLVLLGHIGVLSQKGSSFWGPINPRTKEVGLAILGFFIFGLTETIKQGRLFLKAFSLN